MTSKTLYCAFCGESQHEVSALVEGPGVSICDQCVGTAIEALTRGGMWPTSSNAALLRGLMALAGEIGPKCTAVVEAAMGKGPAEKEPNQ